METVNEIDDSPISATDRRVHPLGEEAKMNLKCINMETTTTTTTSDSQVGSSGMNNNNNENNNKNNNNKVCSLTSLATSTLSSLTLSPSSDQVGNTTNVIVESTSVTPTDTTTNTTSNNNNNQSAGLASSSSSSSTTTTTTQVGGNRVIARGGVRRMKSASLTNAGSQLQVGTMKRTPGIGPVIVGGTTGGAIQRTSSSGVGAGGGGFAPRSLDRARSLRVPPTATNASTTLMLLKGGGGGGGGSSGLSSSSRTNSSRALLLRASSSSGPGGLARSRIAPPTRGLSSTASGGLRPYTRDQIVNTQIERKVNNRLMGPGGTLLQRQYSDFSVGNSTNSFDDTLHSGGDFSLFTMDSINVRKDQQQHQNLIADPLDDKSFLYGGTSSGQDDCSFADHDTYVTRLSSDDFDMSICGGGGGGGIGTNNNNNKHVISENRNHAVLTFDTKTTTVQFNDRLRKLGVTESAQNRDDQSFCTMNSALTNDFNDFGLDDDDDEDDDNTYFEQSCDPTDTNTFDDILDEDHENNSNTLDQLCDEHSLQEQQLSERL